MHKVIKKQKEHQKAEWCKLWLHKLYIITCNIWSMSMEFKKIKADLTKICQFFEVWVLVMSLSSS